MSQISLWRLNEITLILSDIEKLVVYDKHTGFWSWVDRGCEFSLEDYHTGFATWLDAATDAVEPYITTAENIEAVTNTNEKKYCIQYNGSEIEQQIIASLEEADWDDLLRIYRAAIDPNAELVDNNEEGYSIGIPENSS